MTPLHAADLKVIELIDNLDKRILRLAHVLEGRYTVNPVDSEVAELLQIAKTQQQLNRILVEQLLSDSDIDDIINTGEV